MQNDKRGLKLITVWGEVNLLTRMPDSELEEEIFNSKLPVLTLHCINEANEPMIVRLHRTLGDIPQVRGFITVPLRSIQPVVIK